MVRYRFGRDSDLGNELFVSFDSFGDWGRGLVIGY